MASTTSLSTTRLARQAVRSCRSHSAASSCRPAVSFSTSAIQNKNMQDHVGKPPRFAYTPERMKAPFSPHVTKDPARREWTVNEYPKVLDEVLNNILGREGERMLPDELKWLAITHKSFDQGRRGFNDRLAFLGRQICALEAAQSIIESPSMFKEPANDPFATRRKPFEHAALASIDNLSVMQPSDTFTLEKLAKFAVETGLTAVVRWKPRMPENLKGSGFDPIMAGAVYAIIGAVALQQGGKTASRVVRERLIRRFRQG